MPYSVTVESTLQADWHRAMHVVVVGLRVAVSNACEEGAHEARTTHQYKDRTGNLTKSIKDRITNIDAYGAEGEIVAEAKYASFVEGGTKPHEIRPKRARMLAWEGEGGQGDWHFARVVHHPGTKPAPFAGQAYLKAERVLERDAVVACAMAEHVFP